MADSDSREGRGYVEPAALKWLEDCYGLVDPAWKRAFDAPASTGLPAIQVGAAEGRLVAFLIRSIGAKNVVEIGTLAGYSAIWIARVLAPGGHLWTLESEPHHAEVARENIRAAGLDDRVSVVVGDARSSLETLG